MSARMFLQIAICDSGCRKSIYIQVIFCPVYESHFDYNKFRCVLPAECPMLPFTSDLNSWDGGFFPAITNSNQANQDVRSVSWPKSNNPIDKCSDPLKNFHTCGSACPRKKINMRNKTKNIKIRVL